MPKTTNPIFRRENMDAANVCVLLDFLTTLLKEKHKKCESKERKAAYSKLIKDIVLAKLAFMAQ